MSKGTKRKRESEKQIPNSREHSDASRGELGGGRGTRVTGTKEATFWDGLRVLQEGVESLSRTPETDTTPSVKSLELKMETKKRAHKTNKRVSNEM